MYNFHNSVVRSGNENSLLNYDYEPESPRPEIDVNWDSRTFMKYGFVVSFFEAFRPILAL